MPSKSHCNRKIFFHSGASVHPCGYAEIHQCILNISRPAFVTEAQGRIWLHPTGILSIKTYGSDDEMSMAPMDFQRIAFLAPLYPQNLGSPVFKNRYGLSYAYVVGDMAQGISSIPMIKAAGHAGFMGFFGAAGIRIPDLENILYALSEEMGRLSFGVNLIHSPGSPLREQKMLELFLKHQIRVISAAGYLKITAPLVYFRLKGIHQNQEGRIICPNRIMAKVSRMELAAQFLSPPPEKLVTQLVDARLITESEARLSTYIPLANDLTVEADSAGHTDNRPAVCLFPAMIRLRNEIQSKHCYADVPCLGLAGGIGTPASVAAAFAMGADYVLTGSINQACIESGTSNAVRKLLSTVSQTDVAMAPAADMFERGIKVQVLKRGTMFPLRASKLYELYRQYDSFDQIPENQRREIEQKILQQRFDEAWQDTSEFFKHEDPDLVQRAASDPKLKMALVFRSYLGKSSRWAIHGDPFRTNDYQIWCGPSMGAFNDWAKGSFLENPEHRTVTSVGLNLLYGACVLLRRMAVIQAGIYLPPDTGQYRPLPIQEIQEKIRLHQTRNEGSDL